MTISYAHSNFPEYRASFFACGSALGAKSGLAIQPFLQDTPRLHLVRGSLPQLDSSETGMLSSLTGSSGPAGVLELVIREETLLWIANEVCWSGSMMRILRK